MTKHLVLSVMLLFCAVTAVAAPADRPVAILLSDVLPVYEQPVAAFENKISGTSKIVTFNLKGDIQNAPAVMTQLMAHKPSLIFALGAKAAWFSKLATRNHPETAVIFAMVLNWQRYELLDKQPNIAGISADVAPGTQLFNLGLFAPQIKRVGVIYNPAHSAATLAKAREAAALVGVELIAKPINQAVEVERDWRQISSKIDAFWVLNDPVVYTLTNIYWLRDRCIKERVVCIGQSDNATRLGLMLSVNPNSASIGMQAAAMAEAILHGGVNPGSLGVQDPLGTWLTVNTKTAEKVGLALDPKSLSVVDEIVSD